MKNYYKLFFILSATLLFSCSNKVSSDELTFNGKVAQLKGKPYTGNVFETFPNGDIKSEGQLKDGLPVGKFTEYYDNKQIKTEKNYIIETTSSGKSYSWSDGASKGFFKNGKPNYVENYKSGLEDGVFEFYNDKGLKYKIINYKDGKKEGETIEYQYNGTEGVLKFKCTYKIGKPVGLMLQYHENGVIWRKASFIDGIQNGVEEYFNPKGVLIERNVYKSGVKLESQSERFNEIE